MKKLLLILLLIPACAAAEDFTSNVMLKSPTTSPNLQFHECDMATPGCKDTYGNLQWYGPDGELNYFVAAHLMKGSTAQVHRHVMERFSCGTDETDVTSCGRIETDIDSDHPVREFRNMDLYLNTGGSIYMRSPDKNVWKITVDNAGNLVTTDENPPAQPVKN